MVARVGDGRRVAWSVPTPSASRPAPHGRGEGSFFTFFKKPHTGAAAREQPQFSHPCPVLEASLVWALNGVRALEEQATQFHQRISP